MAWTDEAQLSWARLASSEGRRLVRAAEAWMPAEERARHARYVRVVDRDLYALRRGLVREALAELTGVSPRALRFEAGRHGKPALVGRADVSFSVSSNDGLAALLVGRTPVGLDVEPRGPGIAVDLLSRRYFAPEEAAALAAMPSEPRREVFLRHWTLKEAYVKAIGEGLRVPLERIRFRLGPDLGVEGLALGEPPQDVSPAWTFGQTILAEGWLCSGVVARP